MKKDVLFVAWGALLALISGCKDTPEQIPAYLQLKPFTVQANPGGTAWQNITEGWLYINGEFLGVYPLPGTAAVLAEGATEIWLYPGIKENGVSSTPNIYDFLDFYATTVNLKQGEDVSIQPATQYKSQITFAWPVVRTTLDDNSVLVFENRDSDPAINLELVTTDAYSGRSLRMRVDTGHQRMDVATEAVTLPTSGGQQVWLEMHHKNDQPFDMAMLSGSGSSEEVTTIGTVAATASWTKIYINLTDFVVQNGADKQRLYFRVSLPRDNNGKVTQNSGTVMLDNIRIVHF
jgi:hypothetical protein